ncbi:MAG: amidohydrolase [Lachnospiraceae bacterium]|nr:amidohydrolase [Lachnospiraceae bacterium]MCI8996716.1 amidohydrolase [Lachnospiraceae bacterium]MCI9134501.1 amidohydrolase [Lachnospiraceae bacterium]
MRVIDAHLHIFEHLTGYAGLGEFRALGQGKSRWAAGGPIDTMCDPGMGDKGVSYESMLGFMDEHDIERGVLLQAGAYGFHNEYVAEAVAKHPDRFVGAGIIDPFFRFFDQVLDRLLGELNYKIIKLEMSDVGGLCGIHDAEQLWNHPNLEKLCSRLNEMGATLALDIGTPDMESHRVDHVARLAKKYPAMHVVICHLLSVCAGGEEKLKEEISKLKLPNVWFDLAAVPTNMKEYAEPYQGTRACHKIAKEIVGAHRLLWGTDSATVMKEYTYEQLACIVADGDVFTEEEKQLIFLENAKKAYQFD